MFVINIIIRFVLAPNPDVNITLNSTNRIGEQAVLVCRVNAYATPDNITVIWTLGSNMVSDVDGEYTVELTGNETLYNSILTIRELSEKDFGVGYTCHCIIEHFFSIGNAEGNATIYLRSQ